MVRQFTFDNVVGYDSASNPTSREKEDILELLVPLNEYCNFIEELVREYGQSRNNQNFDFLSHYNVRPKQSKGELLELKDMINTARSFPKSFKQRHNGISLYCKDISVKSKNNGKYTVELSYNPSSVHERQALSLGVQNGLQSTVLLFSDNVEKGLFSENALIKIEINSNEDTEVAQSKNNQIAVRREDKAISKNPTVMSKLNNLAKTIDVFVGTKKYNSALRGLSDNIREEPSKEKKESLKSEWIKLRNDLCPVDIIQIAKAFFGINQQISQGLDKPASSIDKMLKAMSNIEDTLMLGYIKMSKAWKKNKEKISSSQETVTHWIVREIISSRYHLSDDNTILSKINALTEEELSSYYRLGNKIREEYEQSEVLLDATDVNTPSSKTHNMLYEYYRSIGNAGNTEFFPRLKSRIKACI
jgi:uncharacterized protein YacL (UPF0231 family)